MPDDSRPIDPFQRAREVGDASATDKLPSLPSLGPFEVLGELGRGGFGCVYRARGELGREVALKVLIKLDPARIERFRREAQATATLSHPNVLKIHSAESAAGRLFLVMELVPGCQTLDQALSTVDQKTGLSLILAAARGLAHAHQRGLTHRDVKPGNLLVGSEGRLRVADFGLVLDAAEDRRLTQTGFAVGTPRYMAPEQCAGLRDLIGPPCDVWALGTILYRYLCGVFPYADSSPPLVLNAHPPIPPREHDPSIPRSLERICRRALAPDPAQRYPTASEFAQDLEAALRPPFRAPRWLAVAVVLGVVLAAGLALGPEPERPLETTAASSSRAEVPQRLATLASDPLATAPLGFGDTQLAGPPRELRLPSAAVSPLEGPTVIEARVSELILWGGAGAALEAFDSALKTDRARADHYLQRGRILVELGRHDQAREDFRSFVRFSPAESPYQAVGLLMACRSWAIEGNRARTLATGAQVMESIRAVHPSFVRLPEIYAEVGRSYVLVGALAEAEQVVAEGQAVLPQDPILQAVRAAVYIERGQLSEAWELFAQGAALTETGADWRHVRGSSKIQVGERAASLADLDAAIAGASLAPFRWLALLARCEQRIELGAFRAAEADLAALAAGPPSWKVGDLRARLALARGELDLAQHELELAQRLSPGRSELELLEARLAWRASRFEEGLEAVDRVLAAGAPAAVRGRAFALRAFLQARLGRESQARDDAKRALSLLPDPEQELRGRLGSLRARPDKFLKEE